MQIKQSYVQKAKVVAHVLQLLFIFIAGCLTIAVFTKGGYVGGGPRWFLALCFLNLPALVYLTMTPMWTRAVRFANAYAFLALDGLLSIFWLSAFISVAMYNSAGIRQGAKDAKKEDGDCTTFAYGSESKCSVSRATVVFGIFIFLLFVLTTAISIRFAVVFRKSGNAPWDTPMPSHTSASALEAQHKDAWSADTHDIDHPDHEGSDTHTERGGNQEEDEYALLHSTETDEGRHPGRPVTGWGPEERYDDTDTSYRGGRYNDHDDRLDRRGSYPNQKPHSPSEALSPGGYDDYKPSGGGYTFSRGDDR